MNRKKLIPVMVFLFLRLPSLSMASTSKKEVLRDVLTFFISVEPIGPEIKEMGFSQSHIQSLIRNDVELRLWNEEIQFLTKKTPGLPCLYVNVTISMSNIRINYNVSVKLSKQVHPGGKINKDKETETVIWEKNSSGWVEEREKLYYGGRSGWSVSTCGVLIKKIRESILSLIEQFINDYPYRSGRGKDPHYDLGGYHGYRIDPHPLPGREKPIVRPDIGGKEGLN